MRSQPNVRNHRIHRAQATRSPSSSTGLRRLEYRGYDSAGIAVVHDGQVDVRRSAGQARQPRGRPRQAIPSTAPTASATRAGRRTAGRPKRTRIRIATARAASSSSTTASSRTTSTLKRELRAQGHTFVTETDTEIVAHLVEREMKDDGLEPRCAVRCSQLRGLFALVLLSADDPEKLVAVRNGPPIVVGLGEGEYFVASDIPAILSHTRDVVFLDDGEMAVVTPSGVTFTDVAGPRARARRRRGSSGTRSWPRRPATSTSCSRRSSSSRAPSARRSSDGVSLGPRRGHARRARPRHRRR